MAKTSILTRLKMKRADELLNAGRFNEAGSLLLQVCRQNPRDLAAWVKLSKVQGELCEYRESERSAARALEIKPDCLEAYYNLGYAIELQGKLDEALAAFRKSLEINPGSAYALGSITRILEKQGDFDAANRFLQRILELGITSIPAAHTFAKICSRYGSCDGAVRYIRKILDSGELQPEDRMKLYFTLGELYDRLGEYDDAFRCIRAANNMKPARADSRRHAANVSRLLETCSREYIAGLPDSGNTSSRPLFIVGMPRSGTTLVEQIVSSHPDVAAAGELTTIPALAGSLAASPETGPALLHQLDRVSRDSLARASEKYLGVLGGVSSGARYVTDKLPYNFLHLGLIQLLFPESRVIHTVRNPLDTCLSCYFLDFAGSHDYTSSLQDLGRFYLQYERIMQHWREVLTIPIIDVQYEELVRDQESITRELISFLGLDWNDSCLRFHESTRFARTASYDQVRQPMYARSVGRWKNYEKYLGPLISVMQQDRDANLPSRGQ